MQDNDAQHQLKKRARRRLVGAGFFASVVALLLPLLMDHDPRPPVLDVAIHIPGQDEKPFAPALVAVPLDGAPDRTEGDAPGKLTAGDPTARPLPPPPAMPEPVQVVPTLEKKPPPVAKPADKPLEAPLPEKKPEPQKPDPSDEARRAAAILSGQFVEKSAPPTVAVGGAHVILIGAFSNAANVRNLQKKLAELGIKTYTEDLESPQGHKTRVRAGPFPNRDAADKALIKMQRIGVSGVVAPRS